MQNSESPRRDPETTSPVASPLLGNLTLVFSTKCLGSFPAAEEVEVAPAELPAGLVSSPAQAARAIAAPPSASARDASRRGPEVLWSPRIAIATVSVASLPWQPRPSASQPQRPSVVEVPMKPRIPVTARAAPMTRHVAERQSL